MKRLVIINTDGACSRNPGGRGGWAFSVRIGLDVHERAGSVPAPTTSNRMELTAVIEALKAIQDQPYKIELFSDSKYVVDGINDWRHSWRKKGWITSTKTPVANVDLWQTIGELTEQHEIQCSWVEGHSLYPDNERCNELAEQMAKIHRVVEWYGPVGRYA